MYMVIIFAEWLSDGCLIAMVIVTKSIYNIATFVI